MAALSDESKLETPPVVDDDTKEPTQAQAQLDAFLNDDEAASVMISADGQGTVSDSNRGSGLFKKIGSMFKKRKSKSSTSSSVDNPSYPDPSSATDIQKDASQLSELVGGDSPWNCEKCTFLNEATELHCIVCFYSRFEVKNLPAQWQWKAADRWITYGIPETIEIENAYKSGAKEMGLTKGWFSDHPNEYMIYFNKEHGDKKHKKKKRHAQQNNDAVHAYDDNSTYFYQINVGTSTRREVRRIASDDDNLFRKLAMTDLDESDRKCMICLHEFSNKDEAAGIIVQLSTCKNHGFHKECIVQWVQLKGNCPLCRIDVDT